MALAVAAGTHLAAFPGHREEGWAIAGFFLLVAIAQLAAAFLLSRDAGPRARAVIIVGNAALVVLWAVSRTVGLPVGGHGGSPEPVALLDLLAVAAEMTVVLGLLARPASGAVRAGLTWPALAVVALLVGGGALRFVPSEHDHVHPARTAPIAATEEPLAPLAHHSHP